MAATTTAPSTAATTASARLQSLRTQADKCRWHVRGLEADVRASAGAWVVGVAEDARRGEEAAREAARKAGEAERRRAEEARELAELREKRAQLEARLAQLREERKELSAFEDRRAALKALAERVERRRGDVAKMEAAAPSTSGGDDDAAVKTHMELIHGMNRSSQLFKRLGLSMKTVPSEAEGGESWLRMEFRLIDKAKPQRVFSFQVRVSEEGQYLVRRVEPMLPNVDALLRRLNETNDFSTFARTLRREWQLRTSSSGRP